MFRRAVLAYPLLFVAYYLAPAFPQVDSAFLADDAYLLLNHSFAGARLLLPPLTSLLLVAVELAALVGLYTLSAHARTLFLLLTLFGMLQILLAGMYIASPVSSALGFVVSLVQGGILAMAYSGSVGRRFQ
jgi:hypothetical protein